MSLVTESNNPFNDSDNYGEEISQNNQIIIIYKKLRVLE